MSDQTITSNGHTPTRSMGSKEKNIAATAIDIVHGDRNKYYGHPKDNHGRTAQMWSAYLGIPISPRQVCMLNALQKIARDAHREKEDNLVDLAGWALNAEICSMPD